MRLLTLLVLPLALAAPTHQSLDLSADNAPDAIDHLSEYFNLLAEKVRRYKVLDAPPECDVSKAVLPTSPDPLPVPDDSTVIRHVAIGRGTQNYTCTANATAAPVPAGAVATLFDASCLAATQPDLLTVLSHLAISYHPSPLPFASSSANAGFGDGPRPRLGPSDLEVSGVHYFTAEGMPFFDLELADAGSVGVAKNASSPAPGDAPVGLGGEKAVGWLRLLAPEGKTGKGGLEEVYRVDTVGGSPPATCNGMPETFQVEYAAQYWFMGKKE
ncbi:related to malate dehydrogenase [Cephalotrichum gorgonifer]|uniref:Related to malate dehydrogenase n=1 Tax=Cephalotrichum gorgonifer TaxID=2041049 RepID=A0AAE8MU19_9PEZI|nr:related to malate dehydrogenase [Cephalotrichum gorgonifer]